MATDSEKKLAEWAINSQLDLDMFFSGSDEERRALVEALARQHYRKGTTEAYINTVGRLWKNIQPILQNEAEEKAVEPKLQRVERLAGETNTRPELRRVREALVVIPREKLSEPRIQRYDNVENRLGQIEKVIMELEPEIGALRKQPFITSSEAREQDVNALLRVAREQGISRAGAQEVATSNVRYRSGASPREFSVREYPIGSYDSETGRWSEGPVFRVFNDENKLVGKFDHRPSGLEIKERWRER